MATTPAPNSPDLSNLWKVWGSLSDFCTKTSFYVYGAKVSSTVVGWVAPGVEGTTNGMGSQLQADAARVARLAPNTGDLGMAVQNGTWGADKWLETARLTWDDLVSLQEAAGHAAFRFGDVWGEVGVSTVDQVQEKTLGYVEDVKDAVDSNFYPILILVVVGLIALAVVNVT